MSIFISIACYRDTEIIPTIQSALNNADRPRSLSFGVCWQGEKEYMEEIARNCRPYRLSIKHIDPKDSKGVGHARYLADSFHGEEEYVLQIDSHLRFTRGWDSIAIDQLNSCKHDRAILTGYLPNYQDSGILAPWKQTILYVRTYNPIVRFGSRHTKKTSSPVPGDFFSGHFAFSGSLRIKEVPNDEWVYFNGEEVHMAIKLYLADWKPFYPNTLIAWHRYGKREHHHWQNNPTWSKLNKISIDRIWQEIREHGEAIGVGLN